MDLSTEHTRIVIPALIPYFVEKGRLWFQEHLQELLQAQNTQAFFRDNLALIEQGQQCHLSEFLRRLDELGYEKVLKVEQPGEFSHTGGIVEAFPLFMEYGVRFEFLGNTIESIGKVDTDPQDEELTRKILTKRLRNEKLFSDIKDIKEGDFLVHLDHGVSRFQKKETLNNQEYYILEYAAGDKLWVPTGLERKLSRYVGFTDPHIARLGSLLWQKTKRKVREDAEKTARELLETYAQKEISLRSRYEPESEVEAEVASSFPYQETPDQLHVLEEIAEDLQKETPMDRLVCGDVGFGKTEIALRTMVKAVSNGYQAALLCPTTILSYQHFQSFTERLSSLPLRFSLLSRLQSKKEQTHILEGLKTGTIDMVIGTHRILSADVSFKNLGLLVIDDEQRFGVKQKEKLRSMKSSLDVLSLSATPIPRTLEMALSSLKKISLIQTPPPGRIAPSIIVAKRGTNVIKEALIQELKRKGQIYYLHNRIGTIYGVQKRLQSLVPGISSRVIHGRLPEHKLIEIMDDFRSQKFSLLIATTLIQNGLDIESVNTIIIEDVSLLGLGEAYQLKGRVGRNSSESFVYFLHGKNLGEKAKLRITALKEADVLGAGYRVALRDLEIRGAGNILGKEQSGSVNAVGLNLYCQILSEAVERLKGMPK
ncbi:MAG: helicase-related protein [bacterium]|nr:helicase-related protein [bacterium]